MGLILDNVIANLSNFIVKKYSWPHLEGRNLANQKLYVSRPVDILLDEDFFSLILLEQSILCPKVTSSVLNFKFEWLVTRVIFSNPAQDSLLLCYSSTDL